MSRSKSEPAVLVGISRRDFNWILFGLFIAMLLSALDNTIVGTALPQIVGQFRGLSKFTWVTTAYVVTSAVSTLVLGKLSDQLGRRKIFLFAITTFVVASVLCGAAQNMNQLILFRAMQGFGGGGLWSLSFAVIGDFVSPRDRGRYFGLFSGVYAVAAVAGPLVGGIIVDHVSWRWIFFFNVPLGLVALGVTATVLRHPFVRRPGKFDAAGAGLVSAAIAGLMIALEEGPHEGWRDAKVVGLFAASAVLVAAFIAHERKAADPLLPLRMFANPSLRINYILSAIVGTTMMSSGLFFGLFFQDVRFYSPTRAGLAMVPMMVAMMGAATMSGRLVAKLGRYRIFPLIGVPASMIGFVLARQLLGDRPYAVLAVAIFFMGLGMGLTMPTLSIAAQNSADTRDLGIATAAGNFFRTVGSSVGLAVNGALFNVALATQLGRRLPASIDRTEVAKIVRAPKQIALLAPPIREAVQRSITSGVVRVYGFAILTSLVSLVVVALFFREMPLRTTIEPSGEDEGSAVLVFADA